MAKQQFILSGTTSERPVVTTLGFMFFDTTIGKPVWWNGTTWTDVSPNATTTTKGLVNRTPLIESITTPDATDAATAQTLANANKAKMNELLQKLNVAGVIIGDIV